MLGRRPKQEVEQGSPCCKCLTAFFKARVEDDELEKAVAETRAGPASKSAPQVVGTSIVASASKLEAAQLRFAAAQAKLRASQQALKMDHEVAVAEIEAAREPELARGESASADVSDSTSDAGSSYAGSSCESGRSSPRASEPGSSTSGFASTLASGLAATFRGDAPGGGAAAKEGASEFSSSASRRARRRLAAAEAKLAAAQQKLLATEQGEAVNPSCRALPLSLAGPLCRDSLASVHIHLPRALSISSTPLAVAFGPLAAPECHRLPLMPTDCHSALAPRSSLGQRGCAPAGATRRLRRLGDLHAERSGR